MRTLKFLIRKEFKQIFRNKTLLRTIILIPIIQLIIIPFAADYEIKNINISIVDHDQSPFSQNLISKITSSGYFKLTDYGNSFDKAFKHLENNSSDLVLEIPQDFERGLTNNHSQQLFIAINAINGSKASVGGTYLGRIISDFNNDIRVKFMPSGVSKSIPSIKVASINWFNSFLNYRIFMVPGILVFLVTMVGAYMSALNIVKEKEVGTIEQINVTPIKKRHFILGKLIPFWIIGMFVFSIGLFGVARIIHGIVPVGSIPLLYGYLGLYLVAVLGVGLLISTYSNTQQQAMSLAFFFIMIFLLMSGLFTPIESMPVWAMWIAKLNPVTYFVEVIRMIVMKGSGFLDIINHILVMIGFALFFNGWAILNYRKTN
jgi:ABC-2 type transport system permease protein